MSFITTNDLAGIGVALQYLTQTQGFTARELAVYFIEQIQNNNTEGLRLIAEITKDPSITKDIAILFLEAFSTLSTAHRGDFTVIWWFFPILSFFILVLRIYSRYLYSNCIRRDDWLMVIGFPIAVAFTANGLWLYYNARWAYHVWDVTLEDVRIHGLLEFIGLWENTIAMLFFKASLLLFYWQLSSAWPPSRWIIGVSWFLVVSYTIMVLVAVTVSTIPLDTWDKPLDVVQRVAVYPFALSNVILATITDVLILIIPMTITWKLDLGQRDRIIVMALFGLGALAPIASIIKVTYYPSLIHSPDVTWASVGPGLWAVVELYTPVIASSVPALRNLLLHYYPNALNRSRKDTPGAISSSFKDGTQDDDKVNYEKQASTYAANPRKEQGKFELQRNDQGGVEPQRTLTVDELRCTNHDTNTIRDIESQSQLQLQFDLAEFSSSEASFSFYDVNTPPGGLGVSPPRDYGFKPGPQHATEEPTSGTGL